MLAGGRWLGFEGGGALTGGIQATGHYPGRARNIQELRDDMSFVLSLVPGPSKVNLHANYLDSPVPVSRDALEPRHFASWADWALEKGVGLDFNSTFFSHPLGENGSLTHPDEGIRAFWIEHEMLPPYRGLLRAAPGTDLRHQPLDS